MSELILVRKGKEVFFEDKKLTIIEHKTKGPDKEVVRIDGLVGSNGQRFVSLSRLKEGKNTLKCKAREVVTITKMILTENEKTQIAEYERKIAEIKENAKKRYVEKPNLNVNVNEMSLEEKQRKLEEMKKFLGL